MKEHTLYLHPEPYASIASGKKTIEIRLFDERRQTIAIGDVIIFSNRQSEETLRVEVLDLVRFVDFKALYAAYDSHILGYEDDEKVHYNDMEKYYTKEQIARYGVLAIKIRLLGSKNI